MFYLLPPYGGLALEGSASIGDNVIIAGNVVLELSKEGMNNHLIIIHSICNIRSNGTVLNNTSIDHCCKVNLLSLAES